MAENKLCPHCGSKMFIAAITRGCVVEVTDDANEPFKLLKESAKGHEIEIVKCARCKKDVTIDDLVMGVPCKECGKIVSPGELNEEGICDVCVAIKQRSDIANASREELIRMLLNAEKGVNPVAAKVEKQIQKAEEIEDTVTATTDKTDNTTEESPADTGKKPTRKKPQNRKKAEIAEKVEEEADTVTPEATTESEVATEAVEEATVPAEEVQQAVDDIAGAQNAPFPDIMDVMNPPEATVSVTEATTEQAVGAGFEMFPQDDEAF